MGEPAERSHLFASGSALPTVAAMLAFAANSLLCRLALGQASIDAASFAGIRLGSGALVLALIALGRRRRLPRPDGFAVAALFVYMAFFSYAYVSLGAGTGTLILFGAVQLTMFGAGLKRGEQFSLPAWLGVIVAALGLVYLVSPGLTAPDPFGVLLMTVAGIAWGAYSLRGQRATDPLAATASNFVYALPLGAGLCLALVADLHVSTRGVLLAATSGAVASGLGYVVWYAALARLPATRAATVQLSVPIIAGFGGVMLLSEPITARLSLAGLATLGGIAVVLAQTVRSRKV